jgi:hypothetical protein
VLDAVPFKDNKPHIAHSFQDLILMTPPPAFGFEQLVTEMLRGLIEAVADRPGETETQRFARHQTAVFSAMAFMPRDAVETMLASQCVMLDHLLRDGTRDLLRGQPDQFKLRLRSQLTAMGRLFLKHLDHLRQLQARAVEQIAVLPVTKAEPRPAAADRREAVPRAPLSGPAESPSRQPSGDAPPTPGPAVVPAAEAEPIAASRDKSALLTRRGFQNRRLRRAIQFKSPSDQARQRP